MTEDRPNIGEYIDELHRDATKLVDLAHEVADSHNAGEHASAALALGLAHYRINDVAADVSNLLRKYGEQGVTPEDALRRMSGGGSDT